MAGLGMDIVAAVLAGEIPSADQARIPDRMGGCEREIWRASREAALNGPSFFPHSLFLAGCWMDGAS